MEKQNHKNGDKILRKTPAQRLADLEKKEAQLKARIQKERATIRKSERKIDTRRKIIAGAIALENMEHDPNFRDIMEGLLKRHVKESDLHLFDFSKDEKENR